MSDLDPPSIDPDEDTLGPPDELNELFVSFDQALSRDDLENAGELLAELVRELGEDDPEVMYCRARLAWADDGPEAAEPLLARVLGLDDAHVDAHYDLACVAEELGDEETMIKHFLRVRALDALLDKEAGLGTPEHFDGIERDARVVLDHLPEPFASRLSHVPVIIERRPSRDLVEEGFDPRAFGLFEGPTDGMQGQGVPQPTRIVLYACNLLAEFPDPKELREQVEVTVLHEVGHYFGLDEDDLERLGLD